MTEQVHSKLELFMVSLYADPIFLCETGDAICKCDANSPFGAAVYYFLQENKTMIAEIQQTTTNPNPIPNPNSNTSLHSKRQS